ncbi:PREDICTED: nuclear autoantigenic sperm protein [Ceratosolen solmsi marchali]|uniref:Nuclear autoantigenic sperm protein n=1 Tax=Ceratosolen solmsi marchali TaxID=326594 RepID=A0AAJ6YS73_9HYME|nr:PREDICTED: nuclear autoantigenic sperm protein [Ceratosolen solmsi marchali]
MADISEMTTYNDPAQAISQGKRHLLVRDYSMAVTALAQGCGMLAVQHGEISDELGEPYLFYGRSLLCLSREEAGVLGAGVPGTDDTEEEEGEEEGEEDESSEKDKEDNEEQKLTEGTTSKLNSDEKHENRTVEQMPSSSSAVTLNNIAESSSSLSNSKNYIAGSSKILNGKASTSTHNGDSLENGDDDADEDENDEDDDSSSNLQLAWEVLELAKIILLKRGPSGWKHLAEAHRLLGEVAMESGNQPGALADLYACLDLLHRIESVDPRSMAETHYQLGLAYSLGNEFDASIEQFKKATSLLESRIQDLEMMTDSPKSDDPFYTIEGEIKELKELLPEIQDKITDMRDFKQQACKLLIQGIKNQVASGSCSNGAGPSGECGPSSSSSTSTSAVSREVKPASDISHLVRKKRKTEDEEADVTLCKKPTPEKSA